MELLTIRQAARHFNVSETLLRRAVRQEAIPFSRSGTRVYLNSETVETALTGGLIVAGRTDQ